MPEPGSLAIPPIDHAERCRVGLSSDIAFHPSISPDPAAAQGQIALEWLEADGRPRLVVTEGLRVAWTNAAARDALLAAGGPVLRDGSLIFSRHADTARFTEYLTVMGATLSTLALPTPSREGHLLFRGRRLRADGPCCLEFALDQPEAVSVLADFDRVFQLTRSEAVTAAALYAGQSVIEVAASRSVSVDTVRSQVRGIYVKMGARSREQFFRKLSPFRIL